MVPVELTVKNGPLEFQDAGGCSMGFMKSFPFDYYWDTKPADLSPEAFATQEKLGGPYSGFGYRKAWLASIKVPSQDKMREILAAAGYSLLATSPAAHDKETMELWGKGFTIPKENKPVEKLERRTVKLVRRPHKRAAIAA